jgi:hypothetical protein
MEVKNNSNIEIAFCQHVFHQNHGFWGKTKSPRNTGALQIVINSPVDHQLSAGFSSLGVSLAGSGLGSGFGGDGGGGAGADACFWDRPTTIWINPTAVRMIAAQVADFPAHAKTMSKTPKIT